ncbi:T9SS type A sorting domain-containing protein [Rhodohalobacter sp. 8-1]|uniref:T9SS type A sorting domain-containing protein n=1 Tax=Rhodohalobacter sp. 8-1 TaxID=3131972 RepID=UPI0030EBAD8E
MIKHLIQSLILIFLFSCGAVVAQDISINFEGELKGDVGEDVSLSVEVSDLTGLNVSNFDIRFSFDSNLISFESDDIVEGDLINSLTANVTDDDRILVSFASSSPISGSGVLFEITGVIVGEGTNDSGVVVTELFFGDGSLDVAPEIPFDIVVMPTSNGLNITNPNRFNLGSNFPNPFNPSTQIIYSLPSRSEVDISLYNIEGKRFANLENATKSGGEHMLSLDLSGHPSGSYFIRFDAIASNGERYSESELITLIK